MDGAVSDPFLPQVLAFARRGHGAFIDGQAVKAGTGPGRAVHDPATEQMIGEVEDSDAATVERAVASARRAFDDGRWSGRTPAARERVLSRFADLVEANGEELAQLETLNQGKSINLSRGGEIAASVGFMRYIAGLPTKHSGELLELSAPRPPGFSYTAWTKHEPVGVVAGISPWNFPLMIALWKIFPALAAGCTTVLKPSEITPLTALRLAELAIEAGLPEGCFNIVNGPGAGAGAALVSNPGVNKISFTGSTLAGKAIARSAVDNLTRCTLELGGKNPAIFCEDVDIDAILPGVLIATFLNQGQVCTAASRLYVHRKVHDRLVDALANLLGTMKMGPGIDPRTQINPLVSRQHKDKVEGFLADVRADPGAKVIGEQPDIARGYFVAPTIVLDPAPDSRLQREEVFGPIIGITPFDDYAEAVRLANDTPMGLGASVWTNDLARTMAISSALKAGTVWVNTHNLLDPAMPFGGFKSSGIGREFGWDALSAYTEVKSVCIATPPA